MIPRLLVMLCIVAVFTPSFFMAGVARALFVPLALAVGFGIIASYFLASTLVPILETWFNRKAKHLSGEESRTWFSPIQDAFGGISRNLIRLRWPIVVCYVLGCGYILYFVGAGLGADIFPRVDTNALQMRIRAPSGTRVERTEVIVQLVLSAVGEIVGSENVERSIAFVGVQLSGEPDLPLDRRSARSCHASCPQPGGRSSHRARGGRVAEENS